MTDEKEFEKELKRIEELPKERICPVCKKKLPKNAHSARKYHKECSKIVDRINRKLYWKKQTKEQIKRHNERTMLGARIKSNKKNPSCSYCQGNNCVKSAIKFDDFTFYPKGGKCSFKPRDKCPNFKPKYPKIYDFIMKNNLREPIK